MARFWINFGESNSATFFQLFKSAAGEEQEKAIKETVEILKIIEEKGLGDKKFFGGEAIGLVDIAFGWHKTAGFHHIPSIACMDSEF
ncbi:unnamed protein product, partial [Vitis vinifera]|uniref:Glutathione S-transferase C-terminal domain-containing protein n=1 Tax=Vitis vinifera TaxID=29760 RepID=D7TS52_VITVI